jgi:hypothetical protein
MKTILLSLLLLTAVILNVDNKVNKNEFKILTGEQWKGKLTYLDYSSGKKTSIDANVTVLESKEDDHTWYFINEYPKEPRANNTDTVVISKDLRNINKEKVISRQKADALTVKVVTEEQHNNDGQPMVYRYTYFLSDKSFSVKKEERKAGETTFIQRNMYEYFRN